VTSVLSSFFDKNSVSWNRINRANRGAALQQAERDLHAVQSIHVRRVAQELKANETWKYKRAFSPGVGFFE
jgi:hypothetical protein